MMGVPPDLEPDIIMRKKGKNAIQRNKMKSESGVGSKASIDQLNAISVNSMANMSDLEVISTASKSSSDLRCSDFSRAGAFVSESSSGMGNVAIQSEIKGLDLSNGSEGGAIGSKVSSPIGISFPISDSSVNFRIPPIAGNVVNSIEIKGMDTAIMGSAFDSSSMSMGSAIGVNSSSHSVIANAAGSSATTPIAGIPIKKEEGLVEDKSSPVIEFEKDIAQLCSPGEKNSLLVFWNSLSDSEKEGLVHGLRFTKKKYNKGNDSENYLEESIENVKKLSSVSQRNDLLLRWKDLSNKKKEMVFHKLCTRKIKKQVETNFGKNRIPFKPSSTLFPVAIDMKKSTEFEASDGLQKVGETVINLLPEGVPVSASNDPVVVDLQKLCSMQSMVKEKKIKGKIEIDEVVSKQVKEVCNEIVYHFPSKFSHLDIVNNGEFKFKYVDSEIDGSDDRMGVDDKEMFKENVKNSNGGLFISNIMLEQAKSGLAQEKSVQTLPISSDKDFKTNDHVSYAEKVSGKKLNAANLISVIKKDPNLPEGVVEMPYGDILKGCSPFKTTLYGYFIDKHVNFFNVNKFAHNMWRNYGLEEVMVNEEGIYFFRFSSEQGMNMVLEGGVWMIFESALVVRRWTTGVSSVKGQHDKVPVWVKIYNVPLEYWNGTGLSHIAWEIGKPLDVDAHTAKMCQDSRSLG